MDINVIRGLLTAVMLVLFVSLCGWLWFARAKSDFDEAASLPLRGSEPDGNTNDISEAKQ